MVHRQESEAKTIAAPAGRIFDLLADPAQHALIDGSGTVRGSRGQANRRLSLGAKFGMDMKMGVPYRISNTVVEFDENRLIAWRHFGGHRWRWELTPVDEHTTEVRETFDYSTAPAGALYPLIGFPERNRKGIHASLERLEKVVTD
ncbi:MAG: SRPBCC family protein [Sciscionella sp.]